MHVREKKARDTLTVLSIQSDARFENRSVQFSFKGEEHRKSASRTSLPFNAELNQLPLFLTWSG